jgi:cell division protein FtsL
MNSKFSSKSKRAWLHFPRWVWPLILLLTVMSVWVRLGVVKSTYDVSQADRTIRNLQQEKEQIELRVAGLKSPRRLESIARARFDLSQPRPEQVIYLGAGSQSK